MEYKTTYNTISTICQKISEKEIKAYLVGGISVAIQTNTDLYRQNDDLDLMVDLKDLEKLIAVLQEYGYIVRDKRGIKTGNVVDGKGEFHPEDHELNADTDNKSLLGIGIFVYERDNGKVTTNSYAFNEKEQAFIGTRKVMPEELFDLMYSNVLVDYHGTRVMAASKEYTYMLKSRGKREKDGLDASVLEPYIDTTSEEKIKRIMQLEKRVQRYSDRYNEDGEIESSVKYAELGDAIYDFIKKYETLYPDCTYQSLLDKMMLDSQFTRILNERTDVADILGKLKDFKGLRIKDIAGVAKEIAELYCYSDNFDEEYNREIYSKYYRSENGNGLESLHASIAMPEEFLEYIQGESKIEKGPRAQVIE